METLNLPFVNLRTKIERDTTFVYDTVRQLYAPLTPEEWVRQHFIHFLIRHRGVPPGLMAIEKTFSFQGMPRRADIVVHDRKGRPWMVIECKAPEVGLSQRVFEQLGRYNRMLEAPYSGVTNGITHYCFTVIESGIRFLEDFPTFPEPHNIS